MKYTILRFFTAALLLTFLSPVVINAQEVTNDSDYCVRFTNLDEFREYIFFYDGVFDWNKKQITNYDCVSFAVNTTPRLLAVPRENYIRGEVLSNINSPAAIVVNYTFVQPGTTNNSTNPSSTTDGANSTGSSSTTGDDTGTTETEAEITNPDNQVSTPTQTEQIVLSPELQGLEIIDSVELALDTQTNQFEGIPVFVTYKKVEGEKVTQESLDFNPDGSRPASTLNNVNYLPYIIGAAVIATILILVYVFFKKLRNQRAIEGTKPKRTKNQKKRIKRTGSK